MKLKLRLVPSTHSQYVQHSLSSLEGLFVCLSPVRIPSTWNDCEKMQITVKANCNFDL